MTLGWTCPHKPLSSVAGGLSQLGVTLSRTSTLALIDSVTPDKNMCGATFRLRANQHEPIRLTGMHVARGFRPRLRQD